MYVQKYAFFESKVIVLKKSLYNTAFPFPAQETMRRLRIFYVKCYVSLDFQKLRKVSSYSYSRRCYRNDTINLLGDQVYSFPQLNIK